MVSQVATVGKCMLASSRLKLMTSVTYFIWVSSHTFLKSANPNHNLKRNINPNFAALRIGLTLGLTIASDIGAAF